MREALLPQSLPGFLDSSTVLLGSSLQPCVQYSLPFSSLPCAALSMCLGPILTSRECTVAKQARTASSMKTRTMATMAACRGESRIGQDDRVGIQWLHVVLAQVSIAMTRHGNVLTCASVTCPVVVPCCSFGRIALTALSPHLLQKEVAGATTAIRFAVAEDPPPPGRSGSIGTVANHAAAGYGLSTLGCLGSGPSTCLPAVR